MKLLRNFVLLSIFILLTANYTSAQVSKGGSPLSFLRTVKTSIHTVFMGRVDVPSMIAEDEVESSKGIPLRFGAPFEVNYNMNNSGTWETLGDGSRIWRLRIESEGAYSINLVYRNFWMPPGARFYIYNENQSMVIGAFTEDNNKEFEQFATGPVKGDVTILEYVEPVGTEVQGVISIERVVHAYRNLFDRHFLKDGDDFGNSGSCNNNVNCPVGDDWQDDKRAVAMILTSGGFRLCTGALVNNVQEDFTPYFLTANHCLGGQATWLFMFNYESPNCNNIDGPTWMTTSGSVLRATNANSDFALLELLEMPPDSYSVYYAGWSNINSASTSSIGIHHPNGDIKKISFDNNPPSSANYGGGTGGSHWRINAWDDGTTEPGSSGSPLFDQNHRITGQLHGGTASCSQPSAPDYYGKFSQSWSYGTNSFTRLSDWLDPENTGATTLDGLDPLGVSFTADTTHGNIPLDVQFTGSSLYDVLNWTWEFGDGDSSFIQHPFHSYTTPGVFDVTLSAETAEDTRERTQSNYIIALADTLKGIDANITPNQTHEIIIYARNNVPINKFKIPISYSGDIDLDFDSFSTAGCRTSYFEEQGSIHTDTYVKQITFELTASYSGTSPELEAGYGPIIKFYFTTNSITPGDSVIVDISGYSSYNPTFNGSLLIYTPDITSPVLSYNSCCTGIRGNADNDPLDAINVADLTFLVNFVFKGGDYYECEEEANVDGFDIVNIADLVYLVNYVFKGGFPPPACP